jgi:hypothetical protein
LGPTVASAQAACIHVMQNRSLQFNVRCLLAAAAGLAAADACSSCLGHVTLFVMLPVL